MLIPALSPFVEYELANFEAKTIVQALVAPVGSGLSRAGFSLSDRRVLCQIPRHVYNQVLNAISNGQLAPSTTKNAMQVGPRVPLPDSLEVSSPPTLSPVFFDPWLEHKKSLMALKDHLRRVSALNFKYLTLPCCC